MNIGDKVYLKAVGNMAVKYKDQLLIKETKITKVGRKYFEVDGVKFKMENKEQETGGYTADWKLYFSKEEILDEQEFQKLESDIRSKFNAFGKLDLTLDQLKRINEIINE